MLLKTINNKDKSYKPIWLMRQSGRHLKKYNNLRKKHSDFMSFCLSEKSIIEATMIPIKEYNLDAAIIFSDILMLPYGLGQRVEFKKNFGPILGKLDINSITCTRET